MTSDGGSCRVPRACGSGAPLRVRLAVRAGGAGVLCACVVFPAWAQSSPPIGPPTTEIVRSGDKNDKPCKELDEEERRRTDRCKTDEERRLDDQERREKERLARENPQRSSFLRWLHTDGLWMQSSTGSSVYGVIGVHLAVANIGRIHLYGPPGLMLVSHDTPQGRIWRGAFTWGVSFRLGGVKPPGINRRAQLYLNVAKVWTGGDYRNGADMVGLSATWDK